MLCYDATNISQPTYMVNLSRPVSPKPCLKGLNRVVRAGCLGFSFSPSAYRSGRSRVVGTSSFFRDPKSHPQL